MRGQSAAYTGSFTCSARSRVHRIKTWWAAGQEPDLEANPALKGSAANAVVGYKEGQRVIAGAITPSGYSNASLCGVHAQDRAGTAHGWKPIGGWKFGNTIDGCQAEYVLVPDADGELKSRGRSRT